MDVRELAVEEFDKRAKIKEKRVFEAEGGDN
jgi:hypothetical protein